MTGPWYRSRTWKLVHLLDDTKREVFLGVGYRTTMCGKRVRSDRIEGDDPNRAKNWTPLPACEKCKTADRVRTDPNTVAHPR